MSLLDISSVIETQMRSADPTLTPPCFQLGADFLSTERSTPTIILVPGGEQITGPQGQGGDGVSQPQPLFMRQIQIAAHVWCCDIPTVEATLNAFVQAMQVTLWGCFKLASGQWRTASDLATKWGVVYTLNMTWLVPLTRAPDVFATVTSMPLTPVVLPS
jgi:hypothetical protein